MVDTLHAFGARVFNGFAPTQLPKAMFFALDFSAVTNIPIDLEIAEQMAWMEFIQAVHIDNSLSGVDFFIDVSISQQTLKVGMGKQAYLPILVPEKAKFVTRVSGTDNHLIKIQFLNFPVPAIVW